MPGSFLHSFAKPSSDAFINIVRGEMALLWDDKGNEYIDGIGSLWYCQIGHGRTEMAEAVAAQISTLETYSTFDPFTNPIAEALAETISSLSPIPSSRVFLCGSGSESIDSAMKIARTSQIQSGYPERSIIISRDRGYHGTNYGGTSAQGLPLNKVGYGTLLEGVVQVEADDIEAMSLAFQQNKGRIAAVIAEPVQGAGGVWPATREYLEALRRLCDDNGAYLIFDEVITGFGRMGAPFAADYFGVVPDMLNFAKCVTNGVIPLGGAARPERLPRKNQPCRGRTAIRPRGLWRHRQQTTRRPGAGGRRLRNVDRSGEVDAVQPVAFPQELALELQHRRRPVARLDRPPLRHRPLGPRQSGVRLRPG